MDQETKKAIILLRALIFHYHGLDQDEKELLEKIVKDLKAPEEYDWALSFISSDYMSAFDRSKEFLSKVFHRMSEKERLKHLLATWEDNHKKGYVTEMETTAMINIAKDFEVEKEFILKINQ
ncbi:MAG: hypothetical protein KI790_00550 [Cyclobacteriaceae bacterium]|nr:hypothetical protein [Cyclobacteriaceae bacterium HetDA_MAG_MS6]